MRHSLVSVTAVLAVACALVLTGCDGGWVPTLPGVPTGGAPSISTTAPTTAPTTATSTAPTGGASSTTSTAVPPPASSPLPSPSQTGAGRSGCLPGITLPAGVDARACGPVPSSGTKTPPASIQGAHSFLSPSQNIGCDMYPNGDIRLEVMEHSWTRPSSMKCTSVEPGACGNRRAGGLVISGGAVKMHVFTDTPAWANVRPYVSKYGDLFAYGGNACLVEQTGVTCWNGKTGHGFKTSKSILLYW